MPHPVSSRESMRAFDCCGCYTVQEFFAQRGSSTTNGVHCWSTSFVSLIGIVEVDSFS
jgi:hypothetical protein